MAIDQKTNKHTRCPHCSAISPECLRTRGGLFIPTLEHARMFCHSSNFSSCSHYIMVEKLLAADLLQSADTPSGGRRLYDRMQNNFAVIIKVYDEYGNKLALKDRNTVTIDLSAGGFRLESSQKIPAASLLSFTFGSDFIIPDLTGLAQVRWSSAASDSGKFQAGLSFIDKATQQTINARLDTTM